MTVPGLGLRPLAPAGLIASATDGRTKLDWTPPVGPTPAFYRIYRDGVRLDRTATSTPTYVDPEPNTGALHTYAVSAVSTIFNESVLSAEVVAG
jgi:hypothetical protein